MIDIVDNKIVFDVVVLEMVDNQEIVNIFEVVVMVDGGPPKLLQCYILKGGEGVPPNDYS